jgi:P4 family phage/plasmid primase-like protien
MPEETKPALIGNLDQLARMPTAAVLLIGDDVAYANACRYFPSNPVFGWWDAQEPYVSVLDGRRVIVWAPEDVARDLCVWLAPITDALHCVTTDADLAFMTQAEAMQTLRTPGMVKAVDKARAAPVAAPAQAETPIRPSTVVEMRPRTQAKPDPEPLDCAELAEDALALAFTARYPNLRYVAQWGKWMEWTGAAWVEDTTLHVYSLARELCRDAATANASASVGAIRKVKSAATRAAVENMARSDRAHAARIEQWDADPFALATPGGIVNLRDGSMRPQRMDDYCRKLTNATPGGDCPRWLAFLDQTTGGDQQLQAYLQRLCGYTLTGDTREHSLTFIYGTGGNGKGTFLDTIQHILGTYACNASMEVFTEARGERHSTELARLAGARLVVAQETEQGKRWAEARIKALTGGDKITARFMRQDDFEFTPQLKLIIAGNHKPALRNVDEAMRRRLHMIPFMRKPEQVNKQLRDQLWAERDGILLWAIMGCMEWQAHGLDAPETVKVATNEYFADQDMIAQWISDRCETHEHFSSNLRELHKNYCSWCESMHEPFLRQGEFKDALAARGYAERGYEKSKKIVGLHLTPDAVAAPGAQSRFAD